MRLRFPVAAILIAALSTQASAQLSATKTSDAGASVAPGDVVQYTITVTNNTGTTHNNVTVSDPMPSDLSYIPNSTVATGPQAAQVFEAEDQFGSNSYGNNDGDDNFASNWNEEGSDDGSATAGDVRIFDGEMWFDTGNGGPTRLRRQMNLSASGATSATFSFDYRGEGGMETTDTLVVQVSGNGGSSYTTLETLNGATSGEFACANGGPSTCSGTRSYDISGFIASNTRIRFSVSDLVGGDEEMFIDNVRVVGNGAGSNVTLDNQPGGANGDLDDGTAANLVTAADAFTLDNGDSLTVTFYARVAAVPGGGSVTNTATIDSNEGSAFNAQVTDTIDIGQTIGDRVWYDVDADGNQDAGEVGIAGAIVNLHQGDDCASPVFKTVTTPVGGAYQFAGLSDGVYCVQVYEPSLPSGYQETSSQNPQEVTLAGGGSNATIDFGMRTTACLPIIDFETDAAGNPLSSGDLITDQWEPWGVTFNRILPASNDGAMIFDTNNPSGGDDDLGTPNEAFGGPGVGVEGGVGETGENRAFENNIMILAENSNSSNPDDDGGGGTVEIIIDYPVEVGITTIIDMEENCDVNDPSLGAGEVRAYDAVSGGNLITSARIPGLGDNSHNSGPFLEGNNGRRVEIELCGSGGIAAISICESFAQEVFSEIGDRVWLDSDGDGIQDVGEPGINNVTVTLYDAGPDMVVGGGDDVVKGTAVTDGLGFYLFQDLKDGTYYVMVEDSTVPSGLELSPGSSATTTPTAVTNGDSNLSHDIGYTATSGTAIIGDLVWNDGDNDGVRDPGEPGIGNVTLELLSAGTDGVLGTGDDVVEATVTTTADGRYLFAGVAPGDYIVDVTDGNNALTGYTLSVGAQSNPDPSAPLTMAADEVRLDIDFGYHNPSLVAITDRLWLDGDQDGVQDAGEPGISGVTVDLVNSSGVVIATDISDSNGDVSFAGIEDGDYDLRVTDTFGRLTDYDGTTTPADNGSLDVFVFGFDVNGINFGYYGFGTIGDTVFSDSDGDGVQDPGELGINNVTLTLWRDANGDQILQTGTDVQIDSTTTTADGMYLFNNVYVGNSAFTYFVSVDDGQAALSGYTGTTTDDEAAAGDQIQVVLQTLGDSNLDADFGYQNASLPNVSGQVWHDIDADGFDDGAGEPGIGNVTIVLINSSGVVVAATTASTGGYQFNDVPAGDYTVAVTDDNDVLDDYTLTSGLDQIPITVVATDITDVDFGYVRSPAQGEIGDLVWLDIDQDGVADGNEPGLGNVQLELRRAITDALVATTTTGPNGLYLFSGLEAGNYYVNVVDATVPAGLSGTSGHVDPTGTINLSRDGSYLDADFGYISSSGSLAGDFVWADVDSDGIQDPGEVGIGGVDITVAPTGAGSPQTVTTAADGSWLVTGLAPGEYTVNFDNADIPAIYDDTPTNTPPQYTFNVSAGGNYLFLDYGFPPDGTTASIGDTVYFDADGDSTQDAGEAGLANVQVELRSGGNIIATMLTDSNGNYDFVGLPAGTYSVSLNDINGVLSGLNATETPPATISLGATEDYNDADFGYEPTGLVIGNQVWRDLNGDGDRDAGEPPVQGVTIQLWLDSNNNGVVNPGNDNLLETTTTNRQGQYYFTGLIAEDYLVRVTDSRGVLAGFNLTSGTAGTDNNSQANPYAITLTTSNNLTADFGYFVPNPAYLLSGNVFEDVDDDGSLTAGDVDVEDAELLLYRDLDNDGVLDPGEPLIDTRLSDASGFYSFTNLPNGSYIVESNTTGTAVDGYTQTTQTATAGVQPAVISGANSTGNDFGYNDGAIVVPVTLSWFEAIRAGAEVHLRWETATETANVGFRVYEGAARGVGRALGKPIASHAIDSVETQGYQISYTTAANTFYLADLDTRGKERLHGPFAINQSHGSPGVDSPIDWSSIQAEHAALAAAHRGGNGEADWVALEVDSKGIYAVSVTDIIGETGVDWIGRARGDLRLSNGSQDVGIWVSGGDVLDANSTIYFHGQPVDTLYTDRNVYRLSLDGRGHINATDTRTPAGPVLDRYNAVHTMQDNAHYGFSSPLDDPWYARRLLAFDAPTTESFIVELDAGTGAAATMQFVVWGVTDWPQDNDHHLRVKVNGFTLFDQFFDGTAVIDTQVQIPAGVLINGDNLIEFEAPADAGVDYDLVNIEAFTIHYERALEVSGDHFVVNAAAVDNAVGDRIFSTHFESGSDRTVVIDGFSSGNLQAFAAAPDRLTLLENAQTSFTGSGYQIEIPVSNAYQHILVADRAHPLRPTMAAKWASPIELPAGTDYVMVVHENLAETLQPLADHHQARGLQVAIVTTDQIYQNYSSGIFDAYAIKAFLADAASSHPLRFVLLVGSDSYDYRDYTGNGSLSLLPSLYAPTSDIVTYAPVDPLYVDLTGNSVPDLPVGRLPARTVDELTAIVDKTIEYSNGTMFGTALFTSDRNEGGVSFSAISDQLAAPFDSNWLVYKASLENQSASVARQMIIDQTNTGVDLISYIGHSSYFVWSFDSLLTANSLSALNNSGRYPIVSQWGCWNTYFVHPSQNTMGQAFLMSANRGAAAVLGATTLTQVANEKELGDRVLQRITEQTIGEAVTNAKQDLALSHPDLRDVLLGWTLLGDPAIEMRRE